jgi:hypothetical protein
MPYELQTNRGPLAVTVDQDTLRLGTRGFYPFRTADFCRSLVDLIQNQTPTSVPAFDGETNVHFEATPDTVRLGMYQISRVAFGEFAVYVLQLGKPRWDRHVPSYVADAVREISQTYRGQGTPVHLVPKKAIKALERRVKRLERALVA